MNVSQQEDQSQLGNDIEEFLINKVGLKKTDPAYLKIYHDLKKNEETVEKLKSRS